MQTDKAQHSVEFDLIVRDDGSLEASKRLLARLNLKRGSKVRVRVTANELIQGLRERTVTEEEIERIGTVQFEPRENVVSFLMTEGRLARNQRFKKRAQRQLR